MNLEFIKRKTGHHISTWGWIAIGIALYAIIYTYFEHKTKSTIDEKGL